MSENKRFVVALALTGLALAGAAKNLYDEYAGAIEPVHGALGSQVLTDGNEVLDETARQELAAFQAQHEALVTRSFEEHRRGTVWYFALWAMYPLVALAGVWRFRRRRLASTYLGLAVLYAVVYALYALNGPSDPGGAGHMHVVIVPAFLLIVSAALLLGDTVRALIRGEEANG